MKIYLPGWVQYRNGNFPIHSDDDANYYAVRLKYKEGECQYKRHFLKETVTVFCRRRWMPLSKSVVSQSGVCYWQHR